MTRHTASQAVAAAVARGAVGRDRAKFWLGEIADGRATPEAVDMLWGPGHPVQASSPAPGPDDEMPEYLALFPATAAKAAARAEVAAAAWRAQVEALSDDALFGSLFPARETTAG